MRTLHVLHVIGGGDTGGAMSHLLPLLSALERAGCDVHLLCLGEGGLADEARRRGLSVSVLPMSRAWDPSGAAAPAAPCSPAGRRPPDRRRARRGRTPRRAARWDVVHTHGMRANLPVRLAMRGLRRPALPLHDRPLRPAARLRLRPPGPALPGSRPGHAGLGRHGHLRVGRSARAARSSGAIRQSG